MFDPESVDAEPAWVAFDLPGDSKRLLSKPTGVHHVFVNGTATISEGEPTGSTPGTVLRSGRDTETVATA